MISFKIKLLNPRTEMINTKHILEVIKKLQDKECTNHEVYRLASISGKREDRQNLENRAMADGYIYALYELEEIIKGDTMRLQRKLAQELPVV